MQRLVQVWKIDLTDQFMIYGKMDLKHFAWEMVPYQKCSGIKRIVQQIVVLWRIVFGGSSISNSNCAELAFKYQSLFQNNPEKIESSTKKEDSPNISRKTSDMTDKVKDAFCQKAIIDRQCVITGKKVNVLLSHAPIGFGGEKLHFLMVPKEHRENFNALTEEEYCESMELTKILNNKLCEKREIKNVYLFHKTGIDAGQTVPHWHLHLIFTTNKAQDIWSKLTVFKNILLGSSVMNKAVFEKQVADLRVEFKPLRTDLPN